MPEEKSQEIKKKCDSAPEICRSKIQRAHYDELVSKKRTTRLLSCGYEDRFDPFSLSRDKNLAEFSSGLFSRLVTRRMGRLLDIGCGTGYYFRELAVKADYIAGMDISLSMLGECKKFGRCHALNFGLAQAVAEKLPFRNNSFDMVIGMDVIHHLENPEYALSEIGRVLKEDGIFAGFEPNMLNPVTFIVNSIPAEERGALQTNFPWRLRNLLQRHFLNVELWGENFILTRAGLVSRLLPGLFKALSPSGCVGLSLRQAFHAYGVRK